MNIVSRVIAALRNRSRTRAAPVRTFSSLSQMTPREYFDLLKAYYLNNGLYDEIQMVLRALNIYHEGLKPLRNPAYRVVEFYASTLWIGELQIVTKNAALVEPIQQVWNWSNWAAQKQVFTRWLAEYGNVFTKVAQSEDSSQVFYQLIEPQFVTDYTTDRRGFLTMIRIDTPVLVGSQTRTQTEVWDKPSQTFRQWEHAQGDAELEKLGAPKLAKMLSDFGIDFVPFVHTKLRDIGEARGVSAFVMALDKIDEANLIATRLHQMLFRNNRALWALRANATDPSGRPLPPPNVGVENDTRGVDPIFELADDRMVRLPGNSSLESLVPAINYEAALSILQDHMLEIEHDLPELAYFRIRDMREVSGKAVRLLLTDAINRLLEARFNAEASLVRLDQMALTIAANARLQGFTNLGTFEGGGFAHAFSKREVIPVSEDERATTIQAETMAGIPLITAVRRNEWSDAEIAQLQDDRAVEDDRKAGQAERMLNLQLGNTGG